MDRRWICTHGNRPYPWQPVLRGAPSYVPWLSACPDCVDSGLARPEPAVSVLQIDQQLSLR